MEKIIHVQHIDPELDTMYEAQVYYENEKCWKAFVCGMVRVLNKSLYREIEAPANCPGLQCRVERRAS